MTMLTELSGEAFLKEFHRLALKYTDDPILTQYFSGLHTDVVTVEELAVRLILLYEFNNRIGQHILENECPLLYQFLYSQVQRDHSHSREYITDELKQVTENLLKAILLGYSEATQLATKKSKTKDPSPLKTPATMANTHEYK